MKERIELIKKLKADIEKETAEAKAGLAPLGVALSALSCAADNLGYFAAAQEPKAEPKK